jgi:uncharacterized protein YutE (UPF0331/DUF86 family)
MSNIFNLLENFNWAEAYYVFQIIFLVLDFLLVVGIIIVLPRALKFRPLFHPPLPDLNSLPSKENENKLNLEELKAEWEEIKLKAFQEPPQSFVNAVIDADNFVNKALGLLGIKGEHLADKLENLSFLEINSLEKLWRVHKIKNELVEEKEITLNEEELQEILTAYEDFLKEMKIIS